MTCQVNVFVSSDQSSMIDGDNPEDSLVKTETGGVDYADPGVLLLTELAFTVVVTPLHTKEKVQLTEQQTSRHTLPLEIQLNTNAVQEFLQRLKNGSDLTLFTSSKAFPITLEAHVCIIHFLKKTLLAWSVFLCANDRNLGVQTWEMVLLQSFILSSTTRAIQFEAATRFPHLFKVTRSGLAVNPRASAEECQKLAPILPLELLSATECHDHYPNYCQILMRNYRILQEDSERGISNNYIPKITPNDVTEVEKVIWLLKSEVSCVIGLQGLRLQSLRLQSNCLIQVLKVNDEVNLKLARKTIPQSIVIRGVPANVRQALESIQQILDQFRQGNRHFV